MHEMLLELCSHQAWADAEHWRAFEAHPASLDDAALRERLHHIHLVERAFLSIARAERIVPTKLDDFPGMAALKDYGREGHEAAAAFLRSVSAERLAETVVIPWFKDPPIRITIAQALTQAAMHSHYHRGQNATRLRDLGGQPPLTDFILWLWKGRPTPQWS